MTIKVGDRVRFPSRLTTEPGQWEFGEVETIDSLAATVLVEEGGRARVPVGSLEVMGG